jgi:hypothetical protein
MKQNFLIVCFETACFARVGKRNDESTSVIFVSTYGGKSERPVSRVVVDCHAAGMLAAVSN